MCIEVKGQATPPAGVASSEDLPSVLLEQWLIQVLPRRYHIEEVGGGGGGGGGGVDGIVPLGLCV